MIDRTYELAKWFMHHLEKFPRSHRYGLGKRIEDHLHEILEALIAAQYSRRTNKIQPLESANMRLEMLRYNCRLAHELRFMPHKSHEFAMNEINEIGKMVGGWLKNQRLPGNCSID